MFAGFSRLTAQRIDEQTFGRAVRGYAMREVDDFLDRAAAQVASWQDALAHGRRPITRLLSPREVAEVTFSLAVRGYDMAEVDGFLEELAAEVTRLHAEGGDGAASAPRRLTAADIARKQFAVAVRGYARRDVDRFLDQVAREVARWQDALASGFRPSMRLVTPRDVNEKAFPRALRGYAMLEVDAFLDELTEELSRLQAQEPWRR